jgi:predicted dehydrogenase
MKKKYTLSRRIFLRDLGVIGTTAVFAPGFVAASYKNVNKLNASESGKEKLGVALVGLGGYSTGELGPALLETRHCYLAGIVTGSPEKVPVWVDKYNIPEKNIYNYENFDSISDNPDIDIVYVVLPNNMHAGYTIRAAKAGKHVICEKPMSTSVKDAREMIKSCSENNIKLSIGYRLHFEPHHLRSMEFGQTQLYGPVRRADTAFSFIIGAGGWRLDKEMAGGGPLVDIGIYTIQAACYTMGQLPVEVVEAHYGDVTKPELFKNVEQSVTFTLRFPGGAETLHSTSYAKRENHLEVKADRGWWKLQPAFGYRNIQGVTSEGPMDLPELNQQARQMDAFALSIKEGTPILVPGDMGLRDMIIIEAVYKAADTGKSVKFNFGELNIPGYSNYAEVNKVLENIIY